MYLLVLATHKHSVLLRRCQPLLCRQVSCSGARNLLEALPRRRLSCLLGCQLRCYLRFELGVATCVPYLLSGALSGLFLGMLLTDGMGWRLEKAVPLGMLFLVLLAVWTVFG